MSVDSAPIPSIDPTPNTAICSKPRDTDSAARARQQKKRGRARHSVHHPDRERTQRKSLRVWMVVVPSTVRRRIIGVRVRMKVHDAAGMAMHVKVCFLSVCAPQHIEPE